MVTKEILESHPVLVLKKEIRLSNIKGYSTMKKSEIIDLMLKDENKDKFDHIKMAEKKGTKKPVKKVKPNVTELTEKKDKKKVVKVTTFGPDKPPRGKSKKLKTVIKELDEKGKKYIKARKDFGKDDPLRPKKKLKGTHKMPDGTVMTGKEHSPDSKPLKKEKESKFKTDEQKAEKARLKALRKEKVERLRKENK